ncbi:hypothetical protein PsorP6_011658 [Peronosclerospora sorghi]|uniref:Uncharacterized protein n=1 Tax=Peronosclerospora sorghi TaxID=230839 RepID=A0ACC0WJ95_9STRA|nr:hypothetical protein PsorP6_011658 [Peronosclerospora sorghi]
MLTRSQAKASNQPVFIDDQWNDAYIRTKDEQIDAMLAANASERSWDELEEEHSDETEENSDDDAWHSDSDESEDQDEDWLERPCVEPNLTFVQRWIAAGGLVQNVGWTLAVVTLAPMLLYVSLRRSPESMWPLQSPRLAGLFSKVVLNLLTLGAALAALWTVICSSEPLTWTSVTNWREVEIKPPAQCRERLLDEVKSLFEMLGSGSNAPMRRLNDDMWMLVTKLNVPLVWQRALVVAGVVLIVTCFHRVWAKMLVLVTAVIYVGLNVMTEVKMRQQAAVEIFSLDPTFAFVNESIFIAIDGQNLEEGGSVAWIPYWGEYQQMQTQSCSKQHPQRLSNGGVLVTFIHVNEYIPCYLNAKATASAVIVDDVIQPLEAYQCYESIRLRVKDQKSVPGWSLHQPQQEKDTSPPERQEL